MRTFAAILERLSLWMNALGGTVLFLMMMLTVTDVILRVFDRPITGTYELVAMLSAIVIGYAIPQTSQERAHIYVDFLIDKRAPVVRNAIFIFTRLLGIVLFALLSYNLVIKGNNLYRNGDVSQTLYVPFYPVAYAIAFVSFVECFVLISDIIRVFDTGEQS
jgi:TRAP-type C4-dicarboxylate transport system permease small subunit